MNLLMVIAVCGALALHQWLEAATVAFLFSISLMLESWSLQRARKAIEALIDTRPSAVRLVQDNGSVQMVAPEKVQINDKYLVKPGERIPLDGLLISGSTTVNESALTGESIPIVKELGAKVFAGTINGEGAFTATSLAKSDDTKLSQILRLIQQGQSKKAKVELWVERFARVYTPIVLVLAVLIGIVPPLMLNQDWSKSIYHALNLLVIACPCALVISTPVSIVAALTSAARFGVLVKGGTFLENAAQIQTLAFDKTGTLTEGKPSITDVIPLSGHNEGELLQRAATLESMSEHPLANAIVQYAKERGIEPAAVENFRMVPGKGAEGYFEGKRYRIGSSDYQREVIERNYSVDQGNLHHRIDSLKLQGKTVVVMSTEQHVCGLIALRDNLRRDAIDTVRLLKEAGVQKIVLLSGDHQSTVSVVGEQLGVQECYGGLLPEEKIAFIERLVQDGTVVAMVGDGINDAPALARATLGIAMGGGTDTALETCDIALINNQLTRLPWLIKHSRRTASIIKQNIALAIGVKLLFAGLTVLGVSTLWGAIAADLGASLVVIFNGLRLLKTS
jgi:Cd2+/Zn2+-exporting ATPase